jgi:hypothetical protein
LHVFVVVLLIMSGLERRLSGALKKVMGGSSSCSCEISSQRHSKPEGSPMHEDKETETTEEQEQEQELRVEDYDAPYLDLEGDREMQAYNHVKNHEFIHTPAYDPDLFDKIGMDTEFTTIWKAIGWERVAPIDEQGSRILTIQFLCSLKEVDNGITFRLFGKEYFLTWKNLVIHLGFNSKCSVDLNYSIKGFNCHAFWKLILNQDVV